MEWLGAAAPIVTALIGFLSGAGFGRFRLPGRIRANLAADLALLKDMPEGAARDELRRHVEHQARALVIEQEPWTARERRHRMYGLTMSFAALTVFAIPFTEAWAVQQVPDMRIVGAHMLATVLLLTWSGALLSQASYSRNGRLWRKRETLDATDDEATAPAPARLPRSATEVA